MTTTSDWQPSACILCECNCGIVVQLEDRRIAKIRGDKAHPASQGYTCNKALRLDHYQNNRNRLTAPLRRREDHPQRHSDRAGEGEHGSRGGGRRHRRAHERVPDPAWEDGDPGRWRRGLGGHSGTTRRMPAGHQGRLNRVLGFGVPSPR